MQIIVLNKQQKRLGQIRGTRDLQSWYETIKPDLRDGYQDLNLLRYFNLIMVITNRPIDRMTVYVNTPVLPPTIFKNIDAPAYTIPVTLRDVQVLQAVFLQDNPDFIDPSSKFRKLADMHRSETMKRKFSDGTLTSSFKGKSLYCNKRCKNCGALVRHVRTNKRLCPECGHNALKKTWEEVPDDE